MRKIGGWDLICSFVNLIVVWEVFFEVLISEWKCVLGLKP